MPGPPCVCILVVSLWQDFVSPFTSKVFSLKQGVACCCIFVWVTSYQSGCVACWRAPTGIQRQQGTSRDIKGGMSLDQGVFTFSAKVPKCNSVWPALRLGSKVRPIATLALALGWEWWDLRTTHFSNSVVLIGLGSLTVISTSPQQQQSLQSIDQSFRVEPNKIM